MSSLQTSDMPRTVIFVGGTSYSGSTLLDMMLANDAAGLSCGEVHAVFYPFRPHHLQLEGLSESIDWRAMKASGPKNLYLNLFERFPETRFIVDSSKSPLWIFERSMELKAMGIRTENILIWKSPSEFLASRRKRGQEGGWQKEWINYHRYYFTLIESWRSVKYRSLVDDRSTLPAICASLGIPYFPSKERYWNRDQHTVFGNDSARIHLHDRSSNEFAKVQDSLSTRIDHFHLTGHRTISYTPTADQTVVKDQGERVRQVLQALEERDVLALIEKHSNDQSLAKDLQVSSWYHRYQIVKAKYGLKWLLDTIGR